MLSRPRPDCISEHRWEEFEQRLSGLNEGEFKVHEKKKLRHWLRHAAKECIAEANEYSKARNGMFIQATADAEKCLSLLQILGDNSIATDPTLEGGE